LLSVVAVKQQRPKAPGGWNCGCGFVLLDHICHQTDDNHIRYHGHIPNNDCLNAVLDDADDDL
jgi:hypothetical protein